VWRLFTNFFFFGSLSLDFFFHMFFLVRYCRLLEEGCFRNRAADFLVMLLFGGGLMCCIAPFMNIPPFFGVGCPSLQRRARTAVAKDMRTDTATCTRKDRAFATAPAPITSALARLRHVAGSSLAFMMVYVWGRRNDHVRMSFLGLFQFRAPYLPWVLLGFSMMLGNSPTIDLIGIVVGHIYFYLEDVFPGTPAGRGRKVLQTPHVLELLAYHAQRLTSGASEPRVGHMEHLMAPPPRPMVADQEAAPTLPAHMQEQQQPGPAVE